LYRGLFKEIFQTIKPDWLYSVNIGALRFPRRIFEKIERLYPNDALFAAGLIQRDGIVSYDMNIELEMTDFCRQELLRQIPAPILLVYRS